MGAGFSAGRENAIGCDGPRLVRITDRGTADGISVDCLVDSLTQLCLILLSDTLGADTVSIVVRDIPGS